MGLIKFLIVTICVLYLIRIIARLLLPVLFQNLVKKAQRQADQKYRQQQRQPDGRVRVDYIPPREQNPNADKAGDFVDYEEVK